MTLAFDYNNESHSLRKACLQPTPGTQNSYMYYYYTPRPSTTPLLMLRTESLQVSLLHPTPSHTPLLMLRTESLQVSLLHPTPYHTPLLMLRT